MAGDDHRDRAPVAASEDRLFRLLRIISAGTTLVCVVGLVVVDTLGKLFFGPDFHVSELFFGTLIGALLVQLGLEAPRLLGGRK